MFIQGIVAIMYLLVAWSLGVLTTIVYLQAKIKHLQDVIEVNKDTYGRLYENNIKLTKKLNKLKRRKVI